MKSVFKKTLLVGTVLACGTNAYAADPASASELQEQIRQLQAKVDQLETKQKSGDAVSAAQTDAAGRSQLMQASGIAPFTAGYDKGKFQIQSEDGKFSLQPTFQVQFRNVTNYISEDPSNSDGDASLENGFEIRRAKFGFSGKIFGDFGYKLVWAANRQLTSGGGSGNVFLEDAGLSYKLSDQFTLIGGQFKDPIHHEELVSSARQLAADRSLVNELLGGGVTDRVQGVGVEYTEGAFFATVVFHDGVNSDNTNFRDTPTNGTDWGVSGRIEYTVFGDKKAAYGDFAAMNNKEDLLVIGVGGGASGRTNNNIYLYTVDAQYENTSGLGVYGAILGTTVDPNGDGDSSSDFGGLIQAGYMVTPKWEIFARYGVIDFDSADDLLHEVTVGANHYFLGHNAKLTLDLVVLPDGSVADTGLGYLGSGDELQVVGRVQFQLAI